MIRERRERTKEKGKMLLATKIRESWTFLQWNEAQVSQLQQQLVLIFCNTRTTILPQRSDVKTVRCPVLREFSEKLLNIDIYYKRAMSVKQSQSEFG